MKINCDLCGKIDETLYRTIVEGVELNVCSGCSRFGKVLGPLKRQVMKEPKKQAAEEDKEEKVDMLVEDYAGIIKRKRESTGLSQKDFALKISEKESTLHHIETGAFQPGLSLAKKLEKALGIKIIESYNETAHQSSKIEKGEGFTLGDFIKVKK